jgi:hypothetical protein
MKWAAPAKAPPEQLGFLAGGVSIDTWSGLAIRANRISMTRKLLLQGGACCWLALGALTPTFAADGGTNSGPNTDGFRDTPMLPGSPWHVHDPDRPQPPIVTPGATFSQGAPAPSDAEVLFDGKDLSQWQNAQGGDAAWKVADGYVETAAKGGGIRTRGKWTDFQLHVEWATPNPPRGSGQGSGNSGVLINGMYEIQVLDSYQTKTYADGQAAAIYGQSPPLVNASKPPGEWQTYDLVFESPRWNAQGELVKKACVTVLHNGVVVQNRYEFMGGTDGISREVPWKSLAKYAGPHSPEVFIELQDHNNPVRYRNLWIRKLSQTDPL